MAYTLTVGSLYVYTGDTMERGNVIRIIDNRDGYYSYVTVKGRIWAQAGAHFGANSFFARCLIPYVDMDNELEKL